MRRNLLIGLLVLAGLTAALLPMLLTQTSPGIRIAPVALATAENATALPASRFLSFGIPPVEGLSTGTCAGAPAEPPGLAVLELGLEEIRLGGRWLVTLDQGYVPEAELDGRRIADVLEAVDRMRAANDAARAKMLQAGCEVPEWLDEGGPALLLVIDRRLPWKTVDQLVFALYRRQVLDLAVLVDDPSAKAPSSWAAHPEARELLEIWSGDGDPEWRTLREDVRGPLGQPPLAEVVATKRPVRGHVVVRHDRPFGEWVALADALTGAGLRCVIAGFDRKDEDRRTPPEVATGPRSLRVGEKVPVLVMAMPTRERPPEDGTWSTRRLLDGAECLLAVEFGQEE